jgi:hypothetical protein
MGALDGVRDMANMPLEGEPRTAWRRRVRPRPSRTWRSTRDGLTRNRHRRSKGSLQ